MIKSILIKGFQSHEETLLKFHEGVNVIRGASNSGKSAVLRAFRWVLENRPSGTDFQSSFLKTKTTEVRIALDVKDETVRIFKTKGDGLNQYKFGNTVLKAIGTDVPKEVSSLFDMDQTNFQGQFDSIIFLQDTPGKVASTLNTLIGQDIIDQSFKNADRLLREIRQAENFHKEGVEETSKKLAKMGDVPKLVVRTEELEEKIQAFLNLQSKCTRVSTIIKDLNQIERSISELIPLTLMEEKVLGAIELSSKLNVLTKLRDEVLHVASKISEQESLAKINYKKAEEMMQEAEEKKRKIEIANELQTMYSSIARETKKVSEELQKLEKEFSKYKVCPLCGGDL